MTNDRLCVIFDGDGVLVDAVIEDAVVGIEAANRAGMLSIALVTEGHSVDRFRHADHVVRSLSELAPETIRDWIAQQHLPSGVR